MYSYAHPDKLYYNIQMNRPATNFSSKNIKQDAAKVTGSFKPSGLFPPALQK